jgi:hypothetical protein
MMAAKVAKPTSWYQQEFRKHFEERVLRIASGCDINSAPWPK